MFKFFSYTCVRRYLLEQNITFHRLSLQQNDILNFYAKIITKHYQYIYVSTLSLFERGYPQAGDAFG